MKNLQNNIKTELKAIYHITGDDIFVMESACEIIKNACNNQMGDMNEASFNNENFTAKNVIDSLEQMPMLADKRFVIVKNIEKINESEIKELLKYSENSNGFSVLVLCEQPNKNIFAKVPAENVVCKKLTEKELCVKIDEILQKNSKKMQENTKILLINMCNKDFLQIKNELEKLVFCKNEEEINEEDIKKLVNPPEEYSVFGITSALNKCDADRALYLINKVLENSNFVVLLGLISSFYRRMFFASISTESTAEIAKVLGVQEFAVKKAITEGKTLKPMQMLKINKFILNIDYSIKSGKMASENAMFYLVFGIIKIIKGEKFE